MLSTFLLASLLVGLQFAPPAPDAIRAAPSFAPGERLVATHYFY